MDVRRCDVEAERFQDCVGMINGLCIHAIDTFAELNSLLQDIKPVKHNMKPSKVKWILRKSRLSHLADQVTNTTNTLATALLTLQGLRITAISKVTATGVCALLSKFERSTEVPSDTDNHSGPYLITDDKSTYSSQTSFKSARSNVEEHKFGFDNSDGPVSYDNQLTTELTCDSSCQCQCHAVNRLCTPEWTRNILGSFRFYGNGSILLKRRVCNKKLCHRSGSLRIQVSYRAPAWTLLKDFAVYANAQLAFGLIPTFTVTLPRIIPFAAVVWGIIELGHIVELQRLFSLGQSSPYDTNPDGTSLFKVHS